MFCRINKFLPESVNNLDFTINNVLPDYEDVVVTVTAGLFVVESKSVEQLMLDDVIVDAATAVQRHSLAITKATNIRVASVKQRQRETESNLIEFSSISMILDRKSVV